MAIVFFDDLAVAPTPHALGNPISYISTARPRSHFVIHILLGPKYRPAAKISKDPAIWD